MNSMYGLSHFWQQGDVIIKMVAIILLIMSVLSWVVIAYKIIKFWRLRHQQQTVLNRFWHSKTFAEGLSSLGEANESNVFRGLALDGLHAVEHHANSKDDLHGALNVNEWLSSCLRRSLDNASGRLSAGLPLLASIGSTAPFIGLFGTVWGIMVAFEGIGKTGSASLAVVAPGIAEALIATAVGLVAAIPAVMAYNHFQHKIRVLVKEMDSFSTEFLNIVQRNVGVK